MVGTVERRRATRWLNSSNFVVQRGSGWWRTFMDPPMVRQPCYCTASAKLGSPEERRLRSSALKDWKLGGVRRTRIFFRGLAKVLN